MKKSIFLFFAAILCAMSVSAKTIYLHTGGGGLWNQGGAKFGCHTWGKTEKSGFMTHVEGDIYSFETDDANTDVIFTRVQSSATGIWDKEWNRIQTKIPADKDLCTITGWGGSDYKWSDYAPLASHTFTKNSTLYIDFRAITSDKKGANYPKAGSVGIDYSANAGGTVIPVTFTADVKWAEGTEFIKTDQGGWASIPFKAPSAGQNCAQVAADGKSYTWTTYSEPTVTLSLDKESADAGTEVTVTLTATADNVAGEVTYAFQYSTDNITWNNISSTGNTATQTFAAETRYYKVTMTNGGNTKEATAKFSAIKFHVIGSWDNWNTHNETVEGDVTLALEANKTYEYKITNGTWDIHWGNDGTMTRDNCTDWSFESDNNAKITTDEAGNYVFNVSRNDEGKVKVSVTYPVLTYTVNATAENGTVTGAGTYAQGTEVTLTATPAEGYEFVNWTVGGKEVSTEASYSFTVTADVALVANFAKKVYTVTVAAENGTVEGLAADGKYEHGAEANLTATANEGYEFVSWTEGEEVVSTNAEYTFEVLADRNLVANFVEAAPEINYEEFIMSNLVVTTPAEGLEMLEASDPVNGISVMLGVYEDGTLHEDCLITFQGTELPIVSSEKVTKEYNEDVETDVYTVRVVVAFGGENMGLQLLMYATAPAEPIEVNVTNATATVGDDGWLTLNGTWNELPVMAKVAGYDEEAEEKVYEASYVGEFEYGVWEETESDFGFADQVTVTKKGDVITLVATFTSLNSGNVYNVTITTGAKISTALDNLNSTVAPVKMIENGQLIIVKDGVQYNAQGAILK